MDKSDNILIISATALSFVSLTASFNASSNIEILSKNNAAQLSSKQSSKQLYYDNPIPDPNAPLCCHLSYEKAVKLGLWPN